MARRLDPRTRDVLDVTPGDDRLLPEQRGALERARTVANLLDAAIHIPGTNIRLGLDALVGLAPGVGDLAGAAASGYVVVTAARLGVPSPVLTRMIGNLAVDAAIGVVPFLGDLFDVGWKANLRNIALLEQHLDIPAETTAVVRRGNRRVVILVTLALLLLAAGAIAIGWLVVRAIAHAVR